MRPFPDPPIRLGGGGPSGDAAKLRKIRRLTAEGLQVATAFPADQREHIYRDVLIAIDEAAR